jgi:predicted small secreted protein
MRNRPWLVVCSPARVVACGALLAACSNTIEGAPPDGSQPGSGGTSAGTSSAGSSNAGSSNAGTSGSGSGGASTTGGASSGGTAGMTGGTGPVFPDPPPFEPAAGTLRRLTRAQFRNAMKDVFNVDVNVSELDADNWNGNFATIGAVSVATPERGVEQYHTAVENAVGVVFGDAARRSTFIGCTPTTSATDACLRGFVETMGRRAWRRPLDATEVDALVAVGVNAATELGSAVEGVRWVTIALFTSPNFLYRPELGAQAADGKLRLTGYELASRLAFLVWNSLPDGALLDQAATLTSTEAVRSAAERLLDSPAGREAVGEFAEQYMRLDRVVTQAKDMTLYPEYGAALQAGMIRDMRETWTSIAFDDRTSALDVFSTTKVVVNAPLAALYGVDAAGLDANTFRTVSLPADGPRLGILSKAGFLSQFANQKEGSPTLRGKFMREALLCEAIEPPPGNVDTVLEDPPADMPMTKRQRLERHRTEDACAGCHSAMDPLGLPLETFDAIGRYRTTDHGLPIDPSGDFDEVPVADARDLGVTVGENRRVMQCMVRKYYAFAIGHEERMADRSVVNELAVSFEASGFKLRDLVLDLVTHEAFSVVAPQP